MNSLGQHEKCLQLLKETVPQITRVGVLLNPLNPAWNDYPAVLNDAASTVGVELIRAEARGVPGWTTPLGGWQPRAPTGCCTERQFPGWCSPRAQAPLRAHRQLSFAFSV